MKEHIYELKEDKQILKSPTGGANVYSVYCRRKDNGTAVMIFNVNVFSGVPIVYISNISMLPLNRESVDDFFDILIDFLNERHRVSLIQFTLDSRRQAEIQSFMRGNKVRCFGSFGTQDGNSFVGLEVPIYEIQEEQNVAVNLEDL